MLRQLLPQSFQGQDIFSPLDNDSEIEMPKSDSVLIECKNLVSQVEQGKFWKKNIKTLLDNVSVSFNPGELTVSQQNLQMKQREKKFFLAISKTVHTGFSKNIE